MNTTIVLCRSFTKAGFATRWFTPRTLQLRVLPRSASQSAQPYSIRHQLEEFRTQQEERVNERKVQFLKDQLNNGKLVKAALGQLTQDKNAPENKTQILQEELERCFTVDQVLEQSKTQELSSQYISRAVERIGKICLNVEDSLTRKELDKVMYDERFQSLLTTFLKLKTNAHEASLVLRVMLALSKEDSGIIGHLQPKLTRQLHTMQFNALCGLLVSLIEHQETEFRKQLYYNVLDAAKKRWAEITEPRQLLVLMRALQYTRSKDFWGNLEVRALTVTEHMNRAQLFELMERLGRAKRRNIPLLKNIFFHLTRLGIGSDVGHIKSCLHSMGILNAYDEELLRVITTTLYGNHYLLRKEDLGTLSSILVSLMKLQYKYLELIDSVVDIFMSGPKDAKMSDEQIVENLPVDLLSSIITVCASLNHMPKKWTLGNWLDTVVKKIQNSPTIGPKLWLNTVYSLVVLGKADAAAVSSVLSDPGKKEWDNATSLMKLRDINFAAKNEVKSYDGPYLSSDFLHYVESIRTSVQKEKKQVHKSIVETLTSFLPSNTPHFTPEFTHPQGPNVSMHLVVSEKGEPQPVKLYPVEDELPKSLNLVAIEPLEFGDVLKCTPGITGTRSLHLRQLHFLGYRVIQIPFDDWGQLKSGTMKVDYIKQKLKGVVKENSPSDSVSQTKKKNKKKRKKKKAEEKESTPQVVGEIVSN